MKALFQTWWRQRGRREQSLLFAAAALAASLLLWIAVLRPLDEALADARARHDRAVLALADARAQAATIRHLQRSPAPTMPGPIAGYLGEAAKAAGFPVARVDPGSAGEATLVISAARAPALFAWVGELERRHGLIVDRLSARANSDATIAVEFSFRARGR